MPSDFPTHHDTFTTHHDNPGADDVVEAGDINKIQESIVAVQDFLLGFNPAETLHDQLAVRDTGWQNIGLNAPAVWVGWGTVLKYRIIGNRCTIQGRIAKDVADGNPDIGVAPAEIWPSWYDTTPVKFPVPTEDGSSGAIGTGHIELINELPGDVRLRAHCVGGNGQLGIGVNYIWNVNFSYLLD